MEELKNILKDLSSCIDLVSINLTGQEIYALEKIEKDYIIMQKNRRKQNDCRNAHLSDT